MNNKQKIILFAFAISTTFAISCSSNTMNSGGSTPFDSKDFDLSFYDAKTKAAITGVDFTLGESPTVLSTVTNKGTKTITLSKSALIRSDVMTAKQSSVFSRAFNLSTLQQVLGFNFGDSTNIALTLFGEPKFLGCWTDPSHNESIDTTGDVVSLPTNASCDWLSDIVTDSPIDAQSYSVNFNLNGEQLLKDFTITARALVSHGLRALDFYDDYLAITSNTIDLQKSFQFIASPNGTTLSAPVSFSIEQQASPLLTVTPAGASCTPAPGEICSGTLTISFTGIPLADDVKDYPVTLFVKEGETILARRTFLFQIFKSAIPFGKGAPVLNAQQLSKSYYVVEASQVDQQPAIPMMYVICDGFLCYSDDNGVSFHKVFNPITGTPFTGVTAYTRGADLQEIVIAHAGGVHVVNFRRNIIYRVAGLPEDDLCMTSMLSRTPQLEDADGLNNFGGSNPLNIFHNRFFMLSCKGNIYVATRGPGPESAFALNRAYNRNNLIEQILSLRTERSEKLPKFINLHYAYGGNLILVTDEGLVGLKIDGNKALAVDPDLFNEKTTPLGPLLYEASRTATAPDGCVFDKITNSKITISFTGAYLTVTTANGTEEACTFALRRNFNLFANLDAEIADQGLITKYELYRTLNPNAGMFAGLEFLGFYSRIDNPGIFFIIMREKASSQIKFFWYDALNDATPPTLFDGPVLTGRLEAVTGSLFIFGIFGTVAQQLPYISLITVDTGTPQNSTYITSERIVPEDFDATGIVDYYRYAFSNSLGFVIGSFLSGHTQLKANYSFARQTFEFNNPTQSGDISNDVLDLDITKALELHDTGNTLALLEGTGSGASNAPDIAFLSKDRTNLNRRLEGQLMPSAGDDNRDTGNLYVGVNGDTADVGGVYQLPNDFSSSNRIIALEDPGYSIPQPVRKISLIKVIDASVAVKKFLLTFVVEGVLVLDLQNATIDPTTVQSIAFQSTVPGQSVVAAESLPSNGSDDQVLLTFSNGETRTLTLISADDGWGNFISASHIDTISNPSFNTCVSSITTTSPKLGLTRALTNPPASSYWFTFFSDEGVCVFNYDGSNWVLHEGPLAVPTGGITNAILEKNFIIILPGLKIIPVRATYNYYNPI